MSGKYFLSLLSLSLSLSLPLPPSYNKMYTAISYPSSLFLEPLINPCSEEHLEEPASYHSHEGEKTLGTKVSIDVGPTETIAVGKKGSYPTKVDSR